MATKRNQDDERQFASSITELGVVLGYSRQSIAHWFRQSDPPPRREDGRISIPDVVRWLLEWKSETKGAASRRELEDRKLGAEARLKELELEIRSGEWIHRDHVRREFQARARMVADGIEAVSAELPKDARDTLRRLREAYAAGDVSELLAEKQRVAPTGRTVKKGRGRPRKQRGHKR